jgi:hypothetical protein
LAVIKKDIKMRNGLLIILSLGLIISCQLRTDKSFRTKAIRIDTTFHFKIKDATDIIESKTGTLTRNYKNGSQSIKFEFTQTELRKIQNLYFELNLDTLPDNYVPICSVNILPTFEEEFSINFDGKQKHFIYNSDYVCSDNNSKNIVTNMKFFKDFIIDILKEKDELKHLEDSDIVFY